MKVRSGEKIRLTSVEELLGVSGEQNTTEVEIGKIQAFQNHPFQVRDDDQMDSLVDSIKTNGVLTPVLLREHGDGYEMISGHRRMHAAERAGLTTIPAIIKDMSDDEAIVYMVDANIQREELLPSEKAFAIRMKLDAMKRQAGRPSQVNYVSHNGTHLRSDQELALQIGSSRNQVQRYVRLTMLIPELLAMVDEKKLSFTLGVDISYLEKEVQRYVYIYICSNKTIKPVQVENLRKKAESCYLSQDKVDEVLEESEKRVKKRKELTVPAKVLHQYFSQGTSDEKMLETIVALLEKWKRDNENEAE